VNKTVLIIISIQGERVSRQMSALLALQPQDGQFLIAQRESVLFTDILDLVTKVGHLPMRTLDDVSKYQCVLHSSMNMKLLFVS
jgi:hypothetical protein